MNFLEMLKSKTDSSGDGKLGLNDLENLRGQIPDNKLDALKSIADRNSDGKVGFDDIKNLDFGSIISDAKSAVSSIFRK